MNKDHIRFIEELAANGWRPAIEQTVGGWRLRYTGGESRRVNSVWPNQSTGFRDLETALRFVEDFYRRHGVVPRYQLCPAAKPENLADVLAERGYRFTAHTSVKTTRIDDLLSAVQKQAVDEISADHLTEEWFETYTGASGYAKDSLPIRRGILTRIGPEAHFLLLKKAGQPAATGLGVVERGWLGVFCVVTATEFRRQGLASGVMSFLADWGKANGAKHVYLQVMDDNLPALGLYNQLGFEHLYQYYFAETP